MGRFEELHIEKDFWDDFIVEAFEHIEEIELNAMSLDQNPDDMDIIHTMFRAFHTIKGLSGFVEHTIIQEIAHKTETLMDYCRKGELKVNSRIVDAILKSSDYIKQLCDAPEAYKDESLIDNIEKLLVVLEELAEGDRIFEDAKPSEEPSQEEAPKVEIVQEEAPTVEAPEEEFFSEEIINKEEVPAEPANEESGLEAFAKEITQFETNEETEEEEDKVEAVTQVDESETPVEESSKEAETIVFETSANLTETKVEESLQEVEEIKAEKIEEAAVPTQEELALKSFQKDVIEKLKTGTTAVKEEKTSDAPAVKHASANEEYMKVANYKIDHLVDMMGELIINQALIDQYVSLNYDNDRQLVTNMSGFLRITRELQNLSMSLRMVSLKPTFQKIARIARDTIQELKKNVEFVTSGENTEIDRAVADKLLDPLVHLIKNAISHGVEATPADRVAMNKDPKAKVELNVYSKRGKIFIEIKDDGRGINTEVVYQKALEKGLVDPGRTYTDAEIREFIMMPGFSTAAVIDNISGRGVGMDVVKTQIFKLGGKVDIQSTLHVGSTFTLEVPVNHAIMNGTIVEMNDQQFVVPTVNVKEFLQPTENQWIFTKQERTMIRVRDNIIPIVPISAFFKNAKEPTHVPLVMILELDQEFRAIPIVNVVNRQEVVVKPVGAEFSHLKYISGMSILGTGKVSLILDIDYLFKKEVKE